MSEPTVEKKRVQRKQIFSWLFVGFLIIAVLWLIYWLCWGQFHEYTDDAYVNGNLVRLMPQVAGTVISINTDDTQLVLRGQPLVKLDDTDFQIALLHSQADLAETVRRVSELYENVKQADATVREHKATLDQATDDLKRRVGLLGDRAISREEMQHYTINLDSVKAQYDLAVSKYNAALALVQNTTLYHHPLVEAAKINVKNAYLNFARTTILSPVTGYVAKRSVQLGQQVSMQSALMAIVPLNEVWIDANYKESQLERLRIGQVVALTADAYGSYTFHGKIKGLGAGTGSAFDLLPPQNATGNWIKIVQRLPVRIVLDPDELKKHPLRIGLSARVTTNTFHQTGDILSQTAHDQPIYATTVFNDQLGTVDKLIDDIVRANAVDITEGPTHA